MQFIGVFSFVYLHICEKLRRPSKMSDAVIMLHAQLLVAVLVGTSDKDVRACLAHLEVDNENELRPRCRDGWRKF